MSTTSSRQRIGTTTLGAVTLGWRETTADDEVPVVALHGMASTSATWDRVAARLAEHGRRTVALDLRGHGQSSRPGTYACSSMRDDVLAFLEAHRIDQVDLLGHSLGGHVAFLVARHAPHRVRRLVVEDASPPPASSHDAALGTRRQRAVLGGQSLLLLSRVRRFDVRLARPVLREVLLTPDPRWWADLPTITATTLLVGGGSASHVSSARQRRVAALLPHGSYASVPEAGHRIHSKHLDRFCELVLPALTGRGPAGPARGEPRS